MKLLKLSPDDLGTLWEKIEESLEDTDKEQVVKVFMNYVMEFKPDYPFLDLLRGYSNYLDPYVEEAMEELETKKARKHNYNEEDDDFDYND